MRDELLKEKAEEIKKDLEEWAKSVGFLLPGERLIFSLHLETQPTVVQEHAHHHLNMRTADFFTKERLMSLGMQKSCATRMVNAISNINGWNGQHRDFQTVREFLEAWGNESRLLKCKNVGRKSIRAFLEAMKKVSFSIDG